MTVPAENIHLTLTAHLAALTQVHLLGERTADAVRRMLSELADTLGIPGNVSVSLAVDANAFNRPWLELKAGERPCRYPCTLLARVRSYVTAEPLAHDPDGLATLAWLCEESLSGVDSRVDRAIEFISLACAEIVKLQPHCLLDTAQLTALAAAMPHVARVPDLQRRMAEDKACLRALRRVVSYGISIADRDRLSTIVAAGVDGGRTWDQIAEDLIDAFAPDEIEIRIPREHLRLLTTLAPGGVRREKLFLLMRDGLFYELGWRFPDMRLVCDETLRAGTFAFRLHHLTTLPRVGLKADQCLVNDSVNRLAQLGIPAIATAHPPDGGEAAIETLHPSVASEKGLTTWDAFEYLVLCLSAELRAASPRFVLRRTTEHVLHQLEGKTPALIRAARREFSAEQITRVLRVMLAEQVSVRNIRQLLECMCDYDYIVADAHRNIIFDDRFAVSREPHPDWLAEATQIAAVVRSGLKRQLSHQHTHGANTLRVYLLDPDIERAVAEGLAPDAPPTDAPPLTLTDQERLLAAVREEANIASRVGSPAILTTQDVRAGVRQILAHEFPTLPVLAYQELSPDMSIEPIARISWS